MARRSNSKGMSRPRIQCKTITNLLVLTAIQHCGDLGGLQCANDVLVRLTRRIEMIWDVNEILQDRTFFFMMLLVIIKKQD